MKLSGNSCSQPKQRSTAHDSGNFLGVLGGSNEIAGQDAHNWVLAAASILEHSLTTWHESVTTDLFIFLYKRT